jgi:Na+/proline symporter
VFGLSIIDVVIIALFILFFMLLGARASKKIRSIGDYFMGNRSFGKVMMIAQTFGSGTHTAQPVMVAGASYTDGLSGIWYQWLWLFSTPFFWLLAPVYRRLRYLTIADFYRERFGDGMAILYTLFGLLYFCINIGLVLKGAGTLVAGVTDGNITPAISITLMTVIFIIYGISGGLHAVVINDMVQAFLTMVMSFLIIPFALIKTGGLVHLHAGLPERMFDLVTQGELNVSFVAMMVLNGLIGIVVHPHHMAMNGSGKSELACRIGWTFGTFLKRFATIGWALIGIFAAFLFPGLVFENRELAFGLAARNLLPAGMLGLMLTSFLAAGMSTCDGFMVHASALLTQNVYGTYINPQASEQIKLRLGRIFSIVVVAGGIFFAYAFESVVAGLLMLLKVCSFLGISFWLGLIWKRANRYGALASVLVMAAAAAWADYGLHWSMANQTAFYLAAGTATMIVISLVTRPEPTRQLDKFYRLLETPVGSEAALHAAGIEMIFEGESRPQDDRLPAGFHWLARLWSDHPDTGLLIVDLKSLPARWSWRRYRTDITGFTVAVVLVAGLIVLLQLVAGLGK